MKGWENIFHENGKQKKAGVAAAAAAKFLQSCPTLCDPIDSSPPGSPIPGIFQARILEWVAIAFSTLYSNYTQIGASLALVVKNPLAKAGGIRDVDLIPGSGRSPEEGVAAHGESHRQRSLAGYSP